MAFFFTFCASGIAGGRAMITFFLRKFYAVAGTSGEKLAEIIRYLFRAFPDKPWKNIWLHHRATFYRIDGNRILFFSNKHSLINY